MLNKKAIEADLEKYYAIDITRYTRLRMFLQKLNIGIKVHPKNYHHYICIPSNYYEKTFYESFEYHMSYLQINDITDVYNIYKDMLDKYFNAHPIESYIKTIRIIEDKKYVKN